MTSPIYKVEYYETQLQDLERNLRFMTTLLVCHHLSRIMLYIMNESGEERQDLSFTLLQFQTGFIVSAGDLNA